MKLEIKQSVAEVKEAIKKFDLDYEYELILKWLEENRRLKVFKEESGPKHCYWGFSWEHGYISFSNLENEEQTRKATAMCIYLWVHGIEMPIAKRCANAYVLRYVGIRRI